MSGSSLKGLYLTILDYILWKVFSYQFPMKMHLILEKEPPRSQQRARNREIFIKCFLYRELVLVGEIKHKMRSWFVVSAVFAQGNGFKG